MYRQSALKAAIDLMNMPSRVPIVKSSPLPDDVLQLLRIAARDESAIQDAVSATKRSPETIMEAAEFFIEQVLMPQDTDSYRVLGAGPQATNAELRTNMALLIRWLHPDRDQGGTRAVFISRVTGAWDNLKTDARRAAYDKACRQAPAQAKPSASQKKQTGSRKTSIRHRRSAPPRHSGSIGKHARSINSHRGQQLGFFRRVMLLLFNRTIR